MVKKTLMKAIFVCGFVLLAAGLTSAQSFTKINPPPCDFSDAFYNNNGILTQSNPNAQPPITAELATEPDGRFGTFRQTGPPATGTQVNWVADTTDCSATDPVRRDFRILATTGGNSDDGNSPFSCFDGAPSPGSTGPGQFGPNAVFPQCANQPGANPAGQVPETLEFISILAFLHAQPTSFENNFTAMEGDNTISITNNGTQTDAAGNITGLNPRSISMEYIVSNFEAYASIDQSKQSVTCTDVNNADPKDCTPSSQLALNPCSLGMIRNLQNPSASSVPMPCFLVADGQDANNNTISDVATPNLRQNWRFATNRNAIDGSDNNCITQNDQLCKKKNAPFSDSPFGYFCDDELGMWVITYFWFTKPSNDSFCGPIYQKIGNLNGFTADGFPVILTAHELNDELEGNGCGAEAQEDTGGKDGGAAWLVCPALPDPRNGAIASDAFLDVTTHNSALDPFISNNFSCLQQTGKFCFESSVE